MKSMKKNLRIGLLIALLLLTVNQIFYLCSVQFTCTDKINRGQDLNNYEILSKLEQLIPILQLIYLNYLLQKLINYMISMTLLASLNGDYHLLVDIGQLQILITLLIMILH